MKVSVTSIFTAIFALMLFSNSQSVQARGAIVYNFGGYAVHKIDDLPNTDQFKSTHGHLDLGWAQKEYSLFWAPFWKTDEGDGYVLYVEKDSSIYSKPISGDQLAAIGKITKVDYPDTYEVPFWSKIWGWGIILLLLVAAQAWSRFSAH